MPFLRFSTAVVALALVLAQPRIAAGADEICEWNDTYYTFGACGPAWWLRDEACRSIAPEYITENENCLVCSGECPSHGESFECSASWVEDPEQQCQQN